MLAASLLVFLWWISALITYRTTFVMDNAKIVLRKSNFEVVQPWGEIWTWQEYLVTKVGLQHMKNCSYHKLIGGRC